MVSDMRGRHGHHHKGKAHWAWQHGESKSTPEHGIWMDMLKRCLCETGHAYARYGGRGITVCDRWKDSYAAFLKDMGRRPSPKHSLDRIDNDGDYEPRNCRWATRQEQANNKRTTRRILYNGRLTPLTDVARAIGMRPAKLWKRLFRFNWPVERALETP